MSAAQPRVVADRYRLVEPLGQGGMGRVWRARDELLHRDVAIKELVPPVGLTNEERQEMRERTLREARAIARLTHPNVVRIFDILRTDGDPWIVMEYVASRSLQEVLANDGPLPPQRVAEIGLAMLGALRAAHRVGMVHRDVKPGNVLLGDDGRVVLTDFGLATIPGDPLVTRTGLVLGSPAYIAPERAHDGTAEPAADLWSLGATLYAAVEGQSPYARPSAIATLAALATEPPAPARRAGPLKPVFNGLLRKDPAQRMGADETERILLRAAGRRQRTARSLLSGTRRPLADQRRPSPARSLPPVGQPAPTPAIMLPTPRPSEPDSAEPTPAGPTPLKSEPAGPSSAKPGPAEPTSAEPTPAKSAPAEPTPTGSTPAMAAPAEPTPIGSTPATSALAGPAPGGSAALKATPAEPTPAESAPAEPPPGGSEPLKAAPVGPSPAKSALAGPTLAGSKPLKSEPVGPTPAEPAHDEPDPESAEVEPATEVTPVAEPKEHHTVREPVADIGRAAVPVPEDKPAPAKRRRLLAIAGGVAALAVLVVAVAMNGEQDSGAGPGPTPTVVTTAPPSPAAATPTPLASVVPPVQPPSVAPPAGGVVLPPGWRTYVDRTGFSVAVPADWPVSREGTIVYFREPRGQRRVLGIDQSDTPKPDPVADWKGLESRRVTAGDWQQYERIRIVPVDYFVKAADWEYTYTSRGGVRLHALNRGFIASAHQAHAILWITPDAAWADNRDEFDLIARSFRPIP